MRVLFTSTSGLGHFYPLLPLMRAARAAGDEVLVAISPAGVPSVFAQGFRAVGTAAPHSAASDAFWAALPQAAEPNTYVLSGLFGRLYAEASMPVITDIVTDFRPNLIISEVAEFAGQIVAAKHGIPHVTVGIGSAGLPDLTHSVLADQVDHLRVGAGLEPVGVVPWKADDTRFVTAVPRMLWMSPDDVPTNTFVYRHEDPEGTVPVGPPVRQVGHRRTVYATLGSVAGAMPFVQQAFGPVLDGLGQVDADVLFTVGSLDRTILGPVPPNVHVEEYVPQQVAMCCDAVVAHAGCGTTVAALSRGLPIVAVPLFADQMHNAERITTAGAGLTVNPRSVRTDLAAAVEDVLANPSYSAAAQKIATEIAAAPRAADVLAQLRPAGVH